MDPDENLRQLRHLCQNYRDGDAISAGDIIDLFQALDGWLARGGFVPRAWGSIRLTGED